MFFMGEIMAKWVLKRNKAYIEKIAQYFNISPVAANVMANRGLATVKKIEEYLYCRKEDMHDALLMADMQKGLDIIADAVKNKRKTAVYGDYDVDGVMSTVILYKTLSFLGGDVIFYLPDRQKEGYGMNCDAVRELKEQGVKVILTCDNGIAAHEEIKLAKELKMDVVVIDHHEPAFETDEEGNKKDILPVADAVIDNKRKDCEYPFKMLCAAGMCYKFSGLVFKKFNIENKLENEFLTFAAIATVCDVVDMLDENKIIAKNGLKIAQNTENKGLKALITETGIEGDINEYHAGFVLGPCINATGRLENASLSVKLFIEENTGRAMDYAAELARLNNERKLMTTKAVEKAVEEVENTSVGSDRVLVLYCPDVHESIAGIVAGRIKEKYYKPTIMITKSTESAKGSGRSIEGYNMFEELFKCRDLFIKFGGHPMAAGLSLKEENIDILRKRLNEGCTLTESDLTPVMKIDGILDFKDITMDCAYELEDMAPFGKENYVPLFASLGVVCRKVTLMGRNKDMMRMIITDKNGNSLSGVSFDGYEKFKEAVESKFDENEGNAIFRGENVEVGLDILYNISVNRFNGRENIQLVIKDMRFEWMK